MTKNGYALLGLGLLAALAWCVIASLVAWVLGAYDVARWLGIAAGSLFAASYCNAKLWERAPLLLVLAIALAGSPAAIAADGPAPGLMVYGEHGTKPVPAKVQERSDAIAGWMTRTTGVDVPTIRFHVLGPEEAVYGGPGFYVRGVNYLDGRGALNRDVVEGILARDEDCSATRLLVHELAHSWRDVEDPDTAEGIVEALSIDLTPAACRAAFGWRWWGVTLDGYADRAVEIRKLSRAATGTTTWRSREARLWRRALWAADAETRVAMIRDARERRGS